MNLVCDEGVERPIVDYLREQVISIQDVSVLEGNLNPRALGLVVEWARRYQQELRNAWERARAHQPTGRIEPLE